MANFAATRVRYNFRSPPPKPRDPTRSCAATLEAPRVTPLRFAPTRAPRFVVAAVGAVDVTAITERAEVKDATALVTNALDLP
jgi:hypothetical protein